MGTDINKEKKNKGKEKKDLKQLKQNRHITFDCFTTQNN